MTSTTIRPASKGLRSDNARRGFTFVELVVVISVIAALAAIGFPVWGMITNRVKVNATEALVQSVATAITTYQPKTWTWIDSGTSRPRTYHIFDLNHFSPGTNTPIPDLTGSPAVSTKRFFSIDGYMPPQSDSSFYNQSTNLYVSAPPPDPKPDPNGTYDGNFALDVLNSGYRGFIAMAQPSIKASFISKRGNVVDAWKRPLRIAFAARVFGTQPFGVWSAGLDAKDSIKEGDDYKDDTSTGKVIDDLRSWGGGTRAE